jgi:hypothetical protein
MQLAMPKYVLRDFGIIALVRFQLGVDPPSHLKKREVHDIGHASWSAGVLCIRAKSDDHWLLDHTDPHLSNLTNGTNESNGEWALTVHWTWTQARAAISETDAVFNLKIRWSYDYFDLLGIHHIVQLSRTTGTLEDDSQPVIGSLTLASPIYSCLPFKLPSFSIIFLH